MTKDTHALLTEAQQAGEVSPNYYTAEAITEAVVHKWVRFTDGEKDALVLTPEGQAALAEPVH